jgi:hypothetical protein
MICSCGDKTRRNFGEEETMQHGEDEEKGCGAKANHREEQT